MLKNLCQIEHTIESKVCRFICDNDTPIHFIKESLFQFQRYIGQLEDNAKAQQESQKPMTDAVPVASPEQPPEE